MSDPWSASLKTELSYTDASLAIGDAEWQSKKESWANFVYFDTKGVAGDSGIVPKLMADVTLDGYWSYYNDLSSAEQRMRDVTRFVHGYVSKHIQDKLFSWQIISLL